MVALIIQFLSFFLKFLFIVKNWSRDRIKREQSNFENYISRYHRKKDAFINRAYEANTKCSHWEKRIFCF